MKQKDRILTAKEQEEHRYPVYGQGDPESDIDMEASSVAQDRKTVRAMDEWLEKRVDDPAEMLRPVRQGALIATLRLFRKEFGMNDEI